MSDQPPIDQPTQDELVDQIQESDQDNVGPNPTLRRHIEMFTRYRPVFRMVGQTVIGALVVPLVLGFVLFQLAPIFNSEGTSSELSKVKELSVQGLVSSDAVDASAEPGEPGGTVGLPAAYASSEAYDLSTLQGAIFHGLLTLILPLFVCLVLARALKPGGLAEKYFNWAPVLCRGLRFTFQVLIWVCLPLRFGYTCFETFNDGKWNDSLGRILFIGAMVALAYGFSVTSKALRKWIAESDRSNVWFDSMRHLLLRCLPAIPVALAITSALGYHFTAVEMTLKAIWTLLMVVGVAMVAGLVSRLLLIAQFGIKLRQLQRNDDGEIKNDESIDISEITTQVNRLLRATALVAIALIGWQFWHTVIPTVDYLQNFQKWVSAIGVVVITFILSRNLPGLLEITLLDRLPLDRGGRYAISFIVKYMVGLLGLFLACQILGFSWSNVQWLAGALMVGLGFGLQEIFANIVSGIIILIERPIRVGDVVTVNGTTGTVTKMALRATTIKDLEYRELIVPNKKFITEDVMNWTLTDRKSRLVFRVGVAYGTDTDLVEKTLLKIANRHPLVNADPKPDVVLASFGDSTVNFELRTVIPTREIFSKVQHELNMAIEAEFKSKGIEIAFPQQDIHIKNLKDLPVGGPGSGQDRPGAAARNATGASQTGEGAGGSVSAYLEPMELSVHNPHGIAVGGTSQVAKTEASEPEAFAHFSIVNALAPKEKNISGTPATNGVQSMVSEMVIVPAALKIFAEPESAEVQTEFQTGVPEEVQEPVQVEVQQTAQNDHGAVENEADEAFELVAESEEPDSEFELVVEHVAESDSVNRENCQPKNTHPAMTENSTTAFADDQIASQDEASVTNAAESSIDGPRKVFRFPLKQVRGSKDGVIVEDRRAA